MLKVDWPPAGAILNRFDGLLVPEGLEIEVQGTAPEYATVMVDGHPAEREGEAFVGWAVLAGAHQRLLVRAEHGLETRTLELPLCWDRYSVPRYRVSLEGNILFLRDLAHDDARSLFEHPYLAFWQRMHREYGTKVHAGIYLECPGFHLSEFPDRFHAEWQENADWLRLAFHARAAEPARPYLDTPAEQVEQDYLAVTEQILRFAGHALLSPFTTIGSAEATREACRALHRQGVRGLAGAFLPDGIPDVDRWRAVLAGDSEGRAPPPPPGPRAGYYLDAGQCAALRTHGYWYDASEDLFFIRHDAVLDGLTADEVVPFLDDVGSDPHRGELVEMVVREQCFREDQPHCLQPDIAQRCEMALRWAAGRGLKPVFHEDGFLGDGGSVKTF